MTNPHRKKLQAEYKEGGIEQLLDVASATLQFQDQEIARLRRLLFSIREGMKQMSENVSEMTSSDLSR